MYTHIVHLADIHIKDDMDEYIAVFDTLFQTIINHKYPKPLIVIAGDIIDNRKRITPEVIRQTLHLLDGLSSIGTTIIIDGNHDITENNQTAIRYLEVITTTNTNNNTNLHYLSKSGYYPFDNVTIAFSSLVDSSTDILPYPTDDANQLIIGLGHFPVEGSINSNSERVIKLSKFDNYPLVLLGDIHKAKRYGTNCQYAGSLIAQNHGEEQELHGYMEHDISNIDTASIISRHIPIHNDTQYVTININKRGNIVKPKRPFTKYTRLRLRATNPNVVDSKEDYKDSIEELYNTKVIRLTTDTKHMLSASTSTSISISAHIPTDEEIIQTITDNDNSILDLHRLYRKRIGYHTAHTSTRRWYIKTLTFKNMLSYTTKTTINLQDYTNCITGIIGRNASGKSNLLKIISFALFGEMTLDYADEDYMGKKLTNTNSKTINKHDQSHVLNSTKQSGYTSITISLDDQNYTIDRRYIRTNTNTIKTEVAIISSNGDHMANNKTSAAEYLRRYVKRSASFLTYNVTDKSISGNLLTIEPRDRQAILSNTLDLTIYNTLAEEVAVDLSSTRTTLRDLKTKYDTINNQISNHKDLIDHTVSTADIDHCVKKRDRLYKRRTNDLSNTNTNTHADINDYGKLTELRTRLRSMEQIPTNLLTNITPSPNDDDPTELLETYYKLRSITSIDIHTHTHTHTHTDPNPSITMPTLPTKRVIRPKYELDRKLLATPSINTDITSTSINTDTNLPHYVKINQKRPTSDISAINTAIKKYKQRIAQSLATQQPSVDHIYDIVEDMAEDIAKIKTMKQDIEYNASIDNDIIYNNTLKTKYQQRELARQAVNNSINIDIAYNHVIDLYTETMQHHVTLATNLKETKQTMYTNALTAITNQHTFHTACRKAKYYQQQLSDITNQLISINDQIDIRTEQLNDKINTIQEKIRITSLHDQTTQLAASINTTQKAYDDLYTYHTLLTKKGGIRDLILKQHLTNIAASINKILTELSLVDFTVSFSNTNNTNNGIDMWIHKSTNTNTSTITLHPKQLSGYESLILNIVIKIQLNMYNERGMAEIFFIDEGLDVIDQYNMPKFIALLTYMKQIYKNIFIITHMDDEHIRSKIERVINVIDGRLVL